MEQKKRASDSDRRSFFAGLAALVMGGVAGLVPLLAGMMVVFDPLRRKSRVSGMVRVTSLQALPADGVPRKFNVVADRVDAWNTYRGIPIGAVYLRRTGEKDLSALNVVCPHAGCFVDFHRAQGRFECPCHKSSFKVDGAIDGPQSPSPRAMDALEVELRNETEIWVRFQNFQTGSEEKIPLS